MPDRPLRLILASASPRRLELLHQAGFRPQVVPPDLAEHPLPDESPRDRVMRLAREKAEAVVRSSDAAAPSIVLAADTEVVLDGRSLGKPRDPEDALAMLKRLRNREHEVMSGVHLLRTDDGRSLDAVEVTRVFFRDLGDAVLKRYVESGEPLDKAGAYGIQGRGVLLAHRIDGSWTNVVGLPVERLADWFAAVGVDAWELVEPVQFDSASSP